MGAPYEIIMSPFEIFVAPVGTAFPEPNAVPDSAWALLGKNGKRNQSEDGVTIEHNQTLNPHRTCGSTGPVKVNRTEESLSIGAVIEDLTIELYSKVLGLAFTEQAAGAGVAGIRSVGLHMGTDVRLFAIIVRGPSPYYDGMNAQYQVPYVYQSGNPKPKFNKSVAAGLEVIWSALEDPLATNEEDRFGRLRAVFQNPT